jgi:hypothetical protein
MRSIACAVVAGALLLAGCGGSSSAPSQPTSRIIHLAGSKTSKIVLTPLGAQRLGLQTSTVARASDGKLQIPYASVIYDPSGATYAFIADGVLTFVEVPITVDHITGQSAYLSKGPPQGAQIVTVGAEELYGVQTGVLAQT